MEKPTSLLNFSPSTYDHKSRAYRTKDGRLLVYREALKHKWKCEKCPETFPSFRFLKEHRIKHYSL